MKIRVSALVVLVGCGAPSSPPAPPVAASTTEAGLTYDEAIEGAPTEALVNDRIDGGALELTEQDLREPLRSMAFMKPCRAPSDARVTARIAIRNGGAVGCTVTTTPADPKLASCIDHAIRALRWRESSALDTMTVSY